jgi:GT2 family glycosyltransferase
MDVSIIVCTKNRYEHLKACLESINASYSSYPYKELIIVDSSTEGEIREKVEKFTKRVGGKYIYENREGLSIARNTGIRASSGDVIVFADDDFVVDKDWIRNLIENYNDPKVVCCTGRMLPYHNDEVSQLYEKSMSFDRGNLRYEISQKDLNLLKLLSNISKIGEKRLGRKTPPPYNVGYGFCSFRKMIFNIVGLFDEKLGRGTPSMGSDDVDIYYRILKLGYKIIYEPKAVVFHVHRQTYENLLVDAFSAGHSIKAFIKKYRWDTYVQLIFIGYLFLLIFSLLKLCIKSDDKLKKLIMMEFVGFIRG